MAVLVTGGAGYIGSHMAWALLDAGEEVVVIDRLSTGFRWAVPEAARFYLGDVGDRAMLDRVFAENDIDAVMHFAGSIVVPQSVVGRAHVCTPVTHAHLVCRLLLAKKNIDTTCRS